MLALWRLSRPEAWMASILPLYVGWVLASREIAPAFDAWASFWSQAAAEGATTTEFAATLRATWDQGWRLGAAMVAAGPLL